MSYRAARQEKTRLDRRFGKDGLPRISRRKLVLGSNLRPHRAVDGDLWTGDAYVQELVVSG